MFALENTTGFSRSEIDMLNAALEMVMVNNPGIQESNAADIVNNNWRPSGNTVETLSEIPAR